MSREKQMQLERDDLYPRDFVDRLPLFQSMQVNPWIVAICRRDEPAMMNLRNSIEAWYSHLPPDVKPDFFKRLRETDDASFTSALGELVWHEYCLQRGWMVKYAPSINGLTPDFLVSPSEEHAPFLLEVVTVRDPKDLSDSERRNCALEAQLYKHIKMPFNLWLNYEEDVGEDVDVDAFVRVVHEWLKTLKNVEGSTYGIPVHVRGFQGSVHADYLGEGSPDQVQIGGSVRPFGCVKGSKDRLRDRLQRKAKRYKDTCELPLLIVVCDFTRFGLKEIEFADALLGEEQLVVTISESPSSGLTSSRRKRKGFFNRPNRPHPDRLLHSRHVSTVGWCRVKWEDDDKFVFPLRLFHNPHATKPLDQSLFDGFPQLVEISHNESSVTLDWTHQQDKSLL